MRIGNALATNCIDFPDSISGPGTLYRIAAVRSMQQLDLAGIAGLASTDGIKQACDQLAIGVL